MKSNGFPAARCRAFAAIQVLVLLTFLMTMIGAAMQHNATQRGYLKQRLDGSQALSLAESGAQEALHRLAARPAAGAADRRLGRGGFRAEWRPADSVQGAFDIVSTGWARMDQPGTARKVVRVRAALTRSDPAANWSVRVLSWRVE